MANFNFQTQKRNAPAWYVSFGDLLTLLLCFILSLICYGHIKVIPASDVTAQNDNKNLKSGQQQEVGTSFANRSLEAGSVNNLPELRFVSADLTENDLSDTAKEALHELLEQNHSERFLLRSCTDNGAHVLRSHLLRYGIDSDRQRLEMLLGHCDELEQAVLSVGVDRLER